MVPSLTKYRGVLDAGAAHGAYSLVRYWPAPDVGFFVERYWVVRWDLCGRAPYTQTTLPNPCVNLVFERGRSTVFGVATGAFRRTLEGRGLAFGVKFKPGGFYPFVRVPVALFTNGALRLDAVFGQSGGEIEQEVLAHSEDAQLVAAGEAFLRRHLPPNDENVVLIDRIVDRIAADPSIRKVRELAAAFGRSERTLQRLFRRYVGVGPRWVIARYRLQEAAHRIECAGRLNWADLASDLGYVDQSHFIRDFKAILGKTPAEYAREVTCRRQPVGSRAAEV